LARLEAADDEPVARHVVAGEEAGAQEDEPGMGGVIARLQRIRGSPGRLPEDRAFEPPALKHAQVDAQVGLAAEIGVEVLPRANKEVDRHLAEAAVPFQMQANGSAGLDVGLAERLEERRFALLAPGFVGDLRAGPEVGRELVADSALEDSLGGPREPQAAVVATLGNEVGDLRARAVVRRPRPDGGADDRRPVLGGADLRDDEACKGEKRLHSGRWHTASMLCPSGSNTNAP